MFVPLPIGEPDEVPRLRVIAAQTVERNKRSRPQGGAVFRDRPNQKAALRLAPHQHVMNTYVADVAGLRLSLHFAGAPVLEVFPVMLLMGNISTGVGALSYAAQFNLMAVATRISAPTLRSRRGHPALTGHTREFGGRGSFSMVNSFGFGATQPGTATDLPLWAAGPRTDCRKRVPKSRRSSALRERHLGEPLVPASRLLPTPTWPRRPVERRTERHSRTRDGDGPRRTGTRDLFC
jgi:hypothetical protein